MREVSHPPLTRFTHSSKTLNTLEQDAQHTLEQDVQHRAEKFNSYTQFADDLHDKPDERVPKLVRHVETKILSKDEIEAEFRVIQNGINILERKFLGTCKKELSDIK